MFIWRIVDLIIAAIFIYAGVLKALDPVQFAHDIDHYKILPWTVGVGLAFYLPWLEIFCGLALDFSPFLSRRIVDFDCARCGLPRRHDRCKSSRSRHHLRLFRSRQPELEFPGAPGTGFGDSRRSGCPLLLQRSASACKCLTNAHLMRFGYQDSMIRKLKSGKYRLYSRKKNPKTGKRRNLGTFKTKTAAQKHERAVQFFKRH